MPIETVSEARTFTLVVEGGSLSAAARALQVSPNAVSQRVRALEDRAGVRLLNRTTRSMSLTEEGEALYRRCLRVLDEVEAAEAEISARPSDLRGRVRLAIPTVLSSRSMLDALGELSAAHQGLRVQLVVSDDRALDVIGAGLDIAVQYGDPPDSGLILRRLGVPPIWLCAAPSYLDRRGRPQTPSDLEAHDCLRFLEDRPQDRWPLEGPNGALEAVVGGWFESDSSRVLGDAVYAGLGIGLRPATDVLEAGGALERVLPGYTFAPAPLVALMPPGRHRLGRVRIVLEAVASVVAAVTGS